MLSRLRTRWPGAVAGVVAAAAALAAGDVVARLLDGASLVVAVGNVIIARSPSEATNAAIEIFGTRDKPVLIAGIVAASLLLGAVFGVLSMRSRAIGVLALAAFALTGGLAAAHDPLTSGRQAEITAAAAAAAGAAALLGLLALAGPPAAAGASFPDPAVKRLGRRRFLAVAGGGLATAAVSVPLGRRVIEPAVDVEAQRAAIVLPAPGVSSRPARAAPTPATTPAAGGAPAAAATAAPDPTPPATAGSPERAAEATPGTSAGGPAPTATPEPTPEPTPTSGPTPEAAPAPTPAPVVLGGPETVPGISPLVTPNAEFYRIDTALSVPRVDSAGWRLRIRGMVDREREFSFDDLLAMDLREESVTLACVSNDVGGRLVGNAYWRGVPLPALLRAAGIQAGATQVIGRSVDGFTVGFPTDVALDGRESMVAVGMNGEPLPAEHGFPARLIVPGLYGYVSATKWLKEIELSTLEGFDAYWVVPRRGWAKEGPIKLQSRIDVPKTGRALAAGNVRVAGVAWGGLRGVGAVQLRATAAGGAPASPEEGWMDAVLSEELSDSSWRQWVVDWPAAAGSYELAVRASDRSGLVQTADVRPKFPDGATGHHRIRVTVGA